VIIKPSSAKLDDSELLLDELKECRAQLADNAALSEQDRQQLKERIARLAGQLHAVGVAVPEEPSEQQPAAGRSATPAASKSATPAASKSVTPLATPRDAGGASAAGRVV
jgi:hypothetical protein